MEKIGFQKSENKNISYELPDESFYVQFTDIKEARFGLQGDGPEDLFFNREKSKYYPKLEKLAETLNPHKITDDACNNIFPELVF